MRCLHDPLVFEEEQFGAAACRVGRLLVTAAGVATHV
jgi:hypothetical protein